MYGQRYFLLSVTLVAAATTPALAQSASPKVGVGSSDAQSVASSPDFSGMWVHPYFPGFEPPASGPGPVVNKKRRRQIFDADGRFLRANAAFTGDPTLLVGDYSSAILKSGAAEIVKKQGETELSGGAPTPHNQCWPEGVPFIIGSIVMQVLQQTDKIIILYGDQVRHVRMSEQHPAVVTPSWYGDSVGHYEGDTLVIDTVGVKVGPFAMVDVYGTPHSPALHVVERYRLLDYESAKDALERNAKENFRIPPGIIGFDVEPNNIGKHLQVQFTVADENAFTVPWSATVTYGRAMGEWTEYVCAENPHEYYAGKDTEVPRAEKPDF